MIGLGVAILTVSAQLAVAPVPSRKGFPLDLPDFKHFSFGTTENSFSLPATQEGAAAKVTSMASAVSPERASLHAGPPSAPAPSSTSFASPSRHRTMLPRLGPLLIAGPPPASRVSSAGSPLRGLFERSPVNLRSEQYHRSPHFRGVTQDSIHYEGGPSRLAAVTPALACSPRPGARSIPWAQESVALLASLKNLAHGSRQTRNRKASLCHAQDGSRGKRYRSMS